MVEEVIETRPEGLVEAVAASAGRGALTSFSSPVVALKDVRDDAEARLPEVGLTISWERGEPEDFEHARLFIPTKHPALHALFAGTSWAGRLGENGPWAGVLRQMPHQLRENGKCDKGLDRKMAGLFVRLADVLEI